MMTSRPLLSALALLVCAAPVAARVPGWGPYGSGPARWDAHRTGGFDRLNRPDAPDSREGKVVAAQFLADGAAAMLGHGPVEVVSASGSTAPVPDQATYEAAMVDQLVKAGYDTTKPDPDGGQVMEIRVIRDVLVPEEVKRKPVSGEMAVGVSNRGSMVGMAVAVDLTKPKKALFSTRLDADIRDRATGKRLWEGHAQIATREGDSHWNEQAIATRLAVALFEDFPAVTGEAVADK